MSSLTHEIKVAITKNDIQRLYELKDICDRLHNGIEEYKGFSLLPSDTLYEEMINHINSSTEYTKTLNSKYMRDDMLPLTSTPRDKIPHVQRLMELWMGSIPKHADIIPHKSAILMPKFDGCSCGVKFVRNEKGKLEPTKAVTRGQDAAFHQQKSDILAKFRTISEPLYEGLNASKFKFNKLPYNKLHSISIRGEIVAKNEQEIFTAPAPYVAGKLNGGMEVWTKSVDTIMFIPFEIINVSYNLNNSTVDDDIVSYVPTQLESLQFFSEMNILPFPIEMKELKEDSLEFISKKFDEYKSKLKQPLDGVVYVAPDWTYPQTKDATTPANYNKYAWKPSSEGTSVLREIEYSIGKEGKLTLIAHYDPIRIGAKNYSQAKTAPSHLEKFPGIGIGSIITVKLCGDINPQIHSFERDETIAPYVLPTKCPFCDKKLEHKHNKSSYTITCKNLECPEIMVQKYKNFLHILDIKGAAEKKLRKLRELSLDCIHRSLIPGNTLIRALKEITMHKFLGAINYGTNKQIEDLMKKLPGYPLLTDHLNILDSVAMHMEDPFVYDIIDFVTENITED